MASSETSDDSSVGGFSSSRSLCRIDNSKLTEVIDFGHQPLGNGFLSKEDFDQEYKFHMRVGFSESSHMLQLFDQPAPEAMFHSDYAFFSSLSEGMREHFKQFALEILSDFHKDESPFVLELGSNDGILLEHFASRGVRHLGIEPSQNVAEAARAKGIETVSAFFSAGLAERIVDDYGQVDYFLAANVMCHISNVREVVDGISKLLKPGGLVVFEDPYVGDVLVRNSFDQFYDEHVFMFSATSITNVFSDFGLELVDVRHQLSHGGSMRYYFSTVGSRPISDSVASVLHAELELGVDKLETYVAWANRVILAKDALKVAIEGELAAGRTLCGYAATSKSTTVLNYAGLGENQIPFIADTTPEKVGRYTPGTHIPIVHETHFERNTPDVAVLFAWNHEREILKRHAWFAEKGGRWLTHVPKVRFLD